MNSLICSHVFEIGDFQVLGRTKFFSPYGGFPPITLLPNVLFKDVYWIFLFNFKIGLSLGLSSLMPSMFIIMLIIRIIKTTYFDNTILMAELEGKVP